MASGNQKDIGWGWGFRREKDDGERGRAREREGGREGGWEGGEAEKLAIRKKCGRTDIESPKKPTGFG